MSVDRVVMMRRRSKKLIAIFAYKQRILSIDMKTKIVQHVGREWMRDWKSVRVSIDMKTKVVQHVKSDWMREWKSESVWECVPGSQLLSDVLGTMRWWTSSWRSNSASGHATDFTLQLQQAPFVLVTCSSLACLVILCNLVDDIWLYVLFGVDDVKIVYLSTLQFVYLDNDRWYLLLNDKVLFDYRDPFKWPSETCLTF